MPATGRRQHRVNTFSPRHTDLKAFVGQTVQLTLPDGRQQHVRLLSIGAEFVIVQSVNARWYNRRRHTQQIPLAHITDLVLEPAEPITI
jgi:hypothetical protein